MDNRSTDMRFGAITRTMRSLWLGSVKLKDIAAHFSYHPNYISALLHKEFGKTFSEIVLEKRMDRAAILLTGTTLSIDEIAVMLGYSNTSNFYKAFRLYYQTSPREFLEKSRNHNNQIQI